MILFFLQLVLFFLLTLIFFPSWIVLFVVSQLCNRCLCSIRIETLGRLQRIRAPIEQGSEISVPIDQMDPPPEEQQSQPGTPMNPTAYRSMRDHIHPLRVSAPSCIVPPAEDVAVRP